MEKHLWTRRCLGLVLSVLLAACASPPTPQARVSQADALAAARGWQPQWLAGERFDLVAYGPSAITPQAALTVYIEGDGFAWVNGSTPSDDPTPINPLALRLALAQPQGNAVYIGRPCQYVDAERIGCPQGYWTQSRFAPEVVDAVGQAIDQLKPRFGAQQLTLVGYSGGAAVAALLAARRSDVVRLVTVAGNLDHGAWTRRLNLWPLTGSLNPVNERAALARLPQTHFVGGRDRVIPPILVRNFVAGMPQAEVIVMPEYDHGCCWAERWPELMK